jgi:hypothetical protein
MVNVEDKNVDLIALGTNCFIGVPTWELDVYMEKVGPQDGISKEDSGGNYLIEKKNYPRKLSI